MSITRGERRRRRRPSRRGHRSKRLTLSPLSSRGEGEFTRLRLELLLCLVGETTRRRTDCFSFFQLPFFIRGSTREVLYLRRNKNRLQNLFSLALSCHLGKKERAYRHLPTRGGNNGEIISEENSLHSSSESWEEAEHKRSRRGETDGGDGRLSKSFLLLSQVNYSLLSPRSVPTTFLALLRYI